MHLCILHQKNSDVQAIARYRSKGRLPVVVWRDTVTGAILCRSSQPLSGTIVYGHSQCSEDSQLLDMYRTLCNTNSSGKLLLLDARSPTAVFGNQLTGAGIEVTAQLTNTQVLFAGIENIHSVRRSYDALGAALADDTATTNSNSSTISCNSATAATVTINGDTSTVVQHEQQVSASDSSVTVITSNSSKTDADDSTDHAQNGVTTSNGGNAAEAPLQTAAAAMTTQQQRHRQQQQSQSLRPAVVKRAVASQRLHFSDAESNYIAALQSPLRQRQLHHIQSSGSSNSNAANNSSCSPRNQATTTAAATASTTDENNSSSNSSNTVATWAHYLFGAYGSLISSSSSGHGELQLALNSGVNWLEQLHNSHWLDHVRRILATATIAAKALRSSNTALNIALHCSDGWDRTAQLSSIIQLLLDPYYRTLEGFAVLIEKEWCSFGHKMQDRCGQIRETHGQTDAALNGGTGFNETEFSPVFIQWLDCVWQIARQYPTAFEFNTELLVYIAHHTYRCVLCTIIAITVCNGVSLRLLL
jgi:Myotubularin-like phosphatase domain